MKVSLICTTLNEEKRGLKEFLESVARQTKKPEEFIIVDGGSTDKTVEIIEKFAKKYRWVKLFVVPKTNISKGRNIAIKKAKNEIIAGTDGGCILDKTWLENITKPFENKNVSVVAGVYKPLYTNDFEYYQGLIVCPEPNKINTVSRMSSRSIAFRKKCWEEVNGYPENTYTGEDTLFNLNLLKKGFKIVYAKNAIVFWRMRKTWIEFAKQFYNYGVGDRVSGNIFRMATNFLMVSCFWILLLVMLYFAFSNLKILVILIGLVSIYFLSKGVELFLKTKKIKALFYGTILFFLKRICYIIGVSAGR
jgi:glycosyltransferase involved in cell wall biosynthesis